MGDIDDKSSGAPEDEYLEEDDSLDDTLVTADKYDTLIKAKKLLVYSNNKYLHYEYMARAAEIALQSQHDDGGPYVGAVIVKDCKIVTEAFKVREPILRHANITSRGGLHLYHAEEKAIQNAHVMKQDITGGVLYVTLEPCVRRNIKNRQRRMNTPCVDFIINAGIKSVVIGLLDSDNPHVSGRGVIALANSGIEVVLYNAGLSEELLHLVKLGRMRRESKRQEYLPYKIEFLATRGAYTYLKKIKDQDNIKSGKKRESNRLKKIIDDGLKEYEENNKE
ncbi:MAG: deaminase [Candidatus Woesearchaeota archaeon]